MDFGSAMGLGWGGALPWMSPSFVIIMLWSLFWKGLALWHSAKRNHGWWFVALLVINTVGILEIVYLFAILKKKPAEVFAFTGLTGNKSASSNVNQNNTPHTTNV